MEPNRPVAKRSGQAEAEVLPRGEKENDMDKLFTLTLAIIVCLGTTALLGTSRAVQEKSPTNPQMAADGAFRDGLYQGVLSDRAHLEEDLADRPSGLQLTFQRFGKLLARDQALFDEHLTQRFRPSRHPISPVDVVDPRPFMAFSSAFGLRARPLYLAERPRR